MRQAEKAEASDDARRGLLRRASHIPPSARSAWRTISLLLSRPRTQRTHGVLNFCGELRQVLDGGEEFDESLQVWREHALRSIDRHAQKLDPVRFSL